MAMIAMCVIALEAAVRVLSDEVNYSQKEPYPNNGQAAQSRHQSARASLLPVFWAPVQACHKASRDQSYSFPGWQLRAALIGRSTESPGIPEAVNAELSHTAM